MNEEILKAINDVSKKVNDMAQQLDNFFNELHEQNKAAIDYISMMADIEIPTEEEQNYE